MSRKKLLPTVALVAIGLLGFSACTSDSNLDVSGDVEVSGTDPTEATCDRFNEVNQRFSDADLQAMDSEDVAVHFSEGVAEIEAVSDDAENLELAESIKTLAGAMRSAVDSADGDLDSIHTQFLEQLQGIDVQEAAAHLDETCDARMNL